MGTIAFAGCSFTAGTGFNQDDIDSDCWNSPHLWVNLCHQNIDCFKELNLVNLSQRGASNQDIFEQALYAISSNPDLEYLICAWTSMPRFHFEVGFELYATTVASFSTNKQHNLNDKIISAEYLNNIIDRFRTLIHLQHEIVKVVKYSNLIKKFAHNVKVININAICPWDDKFFIKQFGNFLPSNLTKFTQNEILNCKNRDDEEIRNLYDLQHNQYNQAGGIDEICWVNLYNSFKNLHVDTNFDGLHPGVESNKIYYNLVKKYIEINHSQ
jgi:hypothetical protein